MVVTFLPCAAEIGVTPARVGVPSRCTVQAPQSAMPHPNFVPVSPSSSRSAQSSGVSAGTSRLTALPLMSSVVIVDLFLSGLSKMAQRTLTTATAASTSAKAATSFQRSYSWRVSGV